MLFKRLPYSALFLIIFSGFVWSQVAPAAQLTLSLGRSGQITLTDQSKSAGEFTLIDAKGNQTHKGKWQRTKGILTWSSKTGKPAIAGRTFWSKGAWNVFWEAGGASGSSQFPTLASGESNVEIVGKPPVSPNATARKIPRAKQGNLAIKRNASKSHKVDCRLSRVIERKELGDCSRDLWASQRHSAQKITGDGPQQLSHQGSEGTYIVLCFEMQALAKKKAAKKTPGTKVVALNSPNRP